QYHRIPRALGDEKQTLLDFLNYSRQAVIRKAEGLSEHDARRSLVGSGTSLCWLLKHLTACEAYWFEWAFPGLDVQVATEPVEAARRDTLISAYHAAIDRSNELVAESEDLMTRCRRAGVASEPMTLRWVLVHMLQETARHAGHADILREQLDGSVGH